MTDVRDDLRFDAMLRAVERETYMHELAERQRAADRMGRERREADQAATLERQDGLARDRLANLWGPAVADAIDLNATYAIFEVRGVGLAFSKPAVARPKDRLLLGPHSPIFTLEMRLQRIANIGVNPPRLLQGRRLAHDAHDLDLVAVDASDEQLAVLIGRP